MSGCILGLRLPVLLLCTALGLAGCGGKVEFLTTLPEADANEVIAALTEAGIGASKVAAKEGIAGVEVDKSQTAKAVETLRALGLPRERFAGMGQTFKKDGLISSPIEERARYLYALSQDLSSTLARIDGVLFARVHLVLPERGAVSERDTPSSAAVFIKHRSDANLEILQPQVRRLVVNSIPGLATERVSVVLIPSTAGQREAKTEPLRVLGIPIDGASASTLGFALLLLGLLAAVGLAGSGYLLWRHGLLPAAPGAPGDAEKRARNA